MPPAKPGAPPIREDQQSKTFLPHVQGVRALCLISVLLYHFELESAAGGYLGVDMFFVISGFVMTLSISASLTTGSFTMAKFLEKRFWRLFPALFCTCFLSLTSFYPILLPSEFIHLKDSVMFALLGINNIHLMVTSRDYFGIPSQKMPLLHTWSLSLEQQFYLVYPILLLVLHSRKVSSNPKIFNSIVIFIVSIVMWGGGTVLLPTYPSSKFYFLFARFYEFGIGCILSLTLPDDFFSQPRSESSTIGNILLQEVSFVSGVILWIVGTFDISRIPNVTSRPFFNLFATCLLLSSPRSFLSQVLLQNPISVGIGEASYSVYLLHWPILKFFSFVTECKRKEKEVITPALVLLIFSALSYRFVEEPYRRKGKRNRRMFFIVQVSFSIAIIMHYLLDNYLSRMPLKMRVNFPLDPPKQTIFPVPHENNEFITQALIENGNFMKSKNISGIDAVFVGSSFAHHLLGGARLISARNSKKVLLLSRDNCMFEVAGETQHANRVCLNINEVFWKAIVKVKPKKLFILHEWANAFGKYCIRPHICDPGIEKTVPKAMETFFDNLYRNLTVYGQTNIVIVGTVPRYEAGVFGSYKRCVSMKNNAIGNLFRSGRKESKTFSPSKTSVWANNIMGKYFKRQTISNSLKFVDLFRVFCKSSSDDCYNEISKDIRVPFEVNSAEGRYVFADDGLHLSPWGSLAAGLALEEYI